MSYLDCSKALFYSSQERSVFLLRLAQTYRRETGPSILVLSLDEDMEFYDEQNKRTHKTKSVLIPVGAGFDFVCHRARVAIVFLNDISTDLQTLIPYMSSAIQTQDGQTFYMGVKFEAEMIKTAKEVWKEQVCAVTATTLLARWVKEFGVLVRQSGIEYSVDERVVKAVKIINDTCHQNVPVDQIAREIGLSVPRLSQLFREIVGTSIRSFRLWKRIFFAARSLQQGLSLTEAAIAAGFTDYAQCFRVYKDLGGYHPGKTKKQTDVKVAA